MNRRRQLICSFLDGFTLLEVLIAVAIIGAVVTVLMQSLSRHLELLNNQKKVTRAVFLAEELLGEITPQNMNSEAIKLRLKEAQKDGFDINITVKEGPIEGLKILIIKIGFEKDSIEVKKVVPGYL